ncbi:hypothetical protein HJC23_013576 [Cyclotella cryptica]|uniref:Fucoxanthin chlorophyll a/c binding protein n=1 Tax=Cyclotella cryptica TaxID=29204 RepID=A0ABD3PQM0_9STRA
MKSAIFASLIAGAAAFAPAQTGKATTSLAAFENELGAQPPLGFFDPLGLLDGADQERFDRLRYVELKHGRICQLAFLGQITTRAGFRLPGDISYDGTKFSDIGEACSDEGCHGEGEFVGDFRNGALDFGWDTFDEETKLSKRAIELNNGRAAMMGILGLMVHEQLGGSVPIVGEL